MPVQSKELQGVVHHQQRELLLQKAGAKESGRGNLNVKYLESEA